MVHQIYVRGELDKKLKEVQATLPGTSLNKLGNAALALGLEAIESGGAAKYFEGMTLALAGPGEKRPHKD